MKKQFKYIFGAIILLVIGVIWMWLCDHNQLLNAITPIVASVVAVCIVCVCTIIYLTKKFEPFITNDHITIIIRNCLANIQIKESELSMFNSQAKLARHYIDESIASNNIEKQNYYLKQHDKISQRIAQIQADIKTLESTIMTAQKF